MPLTSIEWIAALFATAALLKFIVFQTNPKALLKLSKTAFSPKVSCLALFAFLGLFWLWIDAGYTVVEFMAAAFIYHALMAHFLLLYPKEMKKYSVKVLKDHKKLWPAWIIFIVLSVWTLKVLFF
jgi:hypothetical protein